MTLEQLQEQLQQSMRNVECNRADALRAEGMVLLLQHQIQLLQKQVEAKTETTQAATP